MKKIATLALICLSLFQMNTVQAALNSALDSNEPCTKSQYDAIHGFKDKQVNILIALLDPSGTTKAVFRETTFDQCRLNYQKAEPNNFALEVELIPDVASKKMKAAINFQKVKTFEFATEPNFMEEDTDTLQSDLEKSLEDGETLVDENKSIEKEESTMRIVMPEISGTVVKKIIDIRNKKNVIELNSGYKLIVSSKIK